MEGSPGDAARDAGPSLGHAHRMARVTLHSGGVSTGYVRLSPRGASERLHPPGDDVNGPAAKGPLACGWCGSTKKVHADSRPTRCGLCLADEAVVAQIAATLAAAGVPPLGTPIRSLQPFARLRRQGHAARGRLAERAKARKSAPATKASKPKAVAPAAQVKQPTGPRRMTDVEKRAAAAGLAARVRSAETELRRPGLPPTLVERLREDLAAARQLLRAWDDEAR